MARIFDSPIITNDQSIDRVLAAGQPTLFIFIEGTAPLALEQMLKRLARENAGKLLVVQVPAKDGPNAARRYEVGQFPAVVAVREGKVLSKAEGITAAELEQHALFLLGTGPQPQPKAKASANGPARSHSGRDKGWPQTVTDATFEQEVLRSPQPVLLDFWAPWCGPCRMVEPILERLAQEMGGRLRVAKINVDENPITAHRYSVQSIPTMMMVKNGQIVDRWAGALPEAALRSRVAPLLS